MMSHQSLIRTASTGTHHLVSDWIQARSVAMFTTFISDVVAMGRQMENLHAQMPYHVLCDELIPCFVELIWEYGCCNSLDQMSV